MKLQISEILNGLTKFSGEGAYQKKVDWLRKHDSQTLRLILKQAFDPTIRYDLPAGPVEYRKQNVPAGLGSNNLYNETRKLAYLWVAPTQDVLDKVTNTQKAQLTEMEKVLTVVGEQVQAAKTKLGLAHQEVQDALEAFNAARVRIDMAKNAVKTLQVELQTIVNRGNGMAKQYGDARQRMLNSNAVMMGEVQSSSPHVPAHTKQLQFTALLESLQVDDAEVLLAVKDKTLQRKYPINKEIVRRAFPDLLPAAADD